LHREPRRGDYRRDVEVGAAVSACDLDLDERPALHDQRSEFLDWAQWTLSAAEAAGRHTTATYGQAASFLRVGNYDDAIESATKGLGTSPLEPRGELICLTYLLAVLGGNTGSPSAKPPRCASTHSWR
jgi:hypothetical protein